MTSLSGGRILVVLHEPGYFRLYGSTVVELGRRGWHVLLAFDRPERRGKEAPQVPRGAGPTVQSVGALPDSGRTGVLAAVRAAVDYLRYLEPRFAEAAYLRRRSEKTLPPAFAFLARVRRVPGFVLDAALGLLRALERVVPAQPDVVRFVRDLAPDAVLVSPLVTLGASGSAQTEVVKAAQSLRVPVMVGVASWDHLTSKGLVRVVPDALMVWNEAQVREAVDLHRIPRGRVVVSGAQSLDHWFEPAAAGATAAFRGSLGIEPGRRVILFVGSSRNMAPGQSEPRFVTRWLAALRTASSDCLRTAFIIVRPHPTNTEPWQEVDLADAGAVVHPNRFSGIPLSDDEVETFRHSLLASNVVVGVNTTAMIEAAILERPVLTVLDEEFTHSQGQTLHFGHLSDERRGCALLARSLDEHVAQLDAVIRDPVSRIDVSRRFVETFIRPRGLHQRATDYLCDAIEGIASGRMAATRAARTPLDEQSLPEPRRSVR